MSDLLRMDYINSLPQPFLVRFCGDTWWWPVNDIAVDVGLIRIDVCGKLQAKSFSDVMEIEDANGGKHDPDDFYSDAEFDGPAGAPSDHSPKASVFSELEPDGYEAERTRRDADQAGSGSEGIARCTPLLAGGLQCSERAAAVGGDCAHGLTENAAVCDTCDGSGVVGYPPDDYWNCPDCIAPEAPSLLHGRKVV